MTACSSPTEALEVVRDHSVDFVITDLLMPGMNGMEVAKAVVRISPACYVMILTGDNLDRLLPAGDSDRTRIEVLLKPLQPQALLARLEELTVVRGLVGSRIPPHSRAISKHARKSA